MSLAMLSMQVRGRGLRFRVSDRLSHSQCAHMILPSSDVRGERGERGKRGGRGGGQNSRCKGKGLPHRSNLISVICACQGKPSFIRQATDSPHDMAPQEEVSYVPDSPRLKDESKQIPWKWVVCI